MKTIKKPKLNHGRGNGSIELPASRDVVVSVPQLELRTIKLQVVGKTPLIVHAWSQKAVRMMLDKQMGIASKGKEKKCPLAEFKGARYLTGDGRFGVPAPAFKACAVTASNSVELKMTQMRQAFHVNYYTIPVTGPEMTPKHPDWSEWDEKYAKDLKEEHKNGIGMRMDLVRLETGVADIRFRPWWPKWECELEVEYNPRMISLEQLVNLFRSGGYGVGICEWRPSAPVCRSGEFGRFDCKTLEV